MRCRFSIGCFFGVCTQPTKVTQPTPLGMPESAAIKIMDAEINTDMTIRMSAPANHNEETCMAVEIVSFDAHSINICSAVVIPWMVHEDRKTMGPRHTLDALSIATESAGSSPCCSVASPPPAPASQFEDFFGVSALSEGQPCGAETCGPYCGPALLEARCPYGTDADMRLQEVLKLLKRM